MHHDSCNVWNLFLRRKVEKKTLEPVKIRILYGRVFLTSLLGISDRSNYHAGERHKTAGLHASSCSRKIEFILCPCLHFLAIKMPTCPGEDGQFQSNGGCLKPKHYYTVHDQTPHRQLIKRLNRGNTATAIF